ncbi:MAG: DinB family protein [Bryobacteraceae bacterium]
MTVREFYIERRRAEFPVFLNVLKSLPADRLTYKPHDRCPSAEQLVWTLVSELKACLDAATQYKAEWSAIPPPPLNEMLRLFEQWSTELTEVVSKMDETSWTRVAHFYYNGKVVSEQPVGQFLWFILFDAIHHRGQLSAYLRPMGGTVPSIYGPSADSRAA